MTEEKNLGRDELSLEGLEGELRQMPAPEAPGELEGRLLADIPVGKGGQRGWYRGRLVRVAVAALVIIGVFGVLAWLISGNGTVTISFAQVIEPIRDAGSLSYTETTQVEGRSAGACYYYMQFELGRSRRSVEGGRVTIMDNQHMGQALILDPATKTAWISKLTLRRASTPVRSIIEEVKYFQAGQETDLGTKEIDGRKAVGFRLRYHRRDYDVWANARTGAPVRIECGYTLRDGRKVQTTITDIELNVQFDENVFSFEPPEGYTIN